MTFLEKARRNSGYRTPVRNSVKERLPEIVEAIDAGASLSGIFRTLTQDGCKVGAGPSSFRYALAALESEIEELRAARRMPRAEPVPPKSDARPNFSDGRYELDWG